MVAISNDTFLADGESALFSCVGYGEPFATITWTRANGAVVGNSSRFSVFERISTQGGITFKQSYIQLCSVFVEDSDAYTCTVSNGAFSETVTVQLLGK